MLETATTKNNSRRSGVFLISSMKRYSISILLNNSQEHGHHHDWNTSDSMVRIIVWQDSAKFNHRMESSMDTFKEDEAIKAELNRIGTPHSLERRAASCLRACKPVLYSYPREGYSPPAMQMMKFWAMNGCMLLWGWEPPVADRAAGDI